MRIEVKKPIDKMYFVYTLCHNGIIFYIGCAKNVRKRYTQHISKGNKSEMGNKIQAIIAAGEMPELNIITYTNLRHARNIEETLIKCIISGGQSLSNKQLNRNPHGIKGNFTDRKQAIDSITMEQNDYILKCNMFGGYYIVSTIGEKAHYPVRYRSS